MQEKCREHAESQKLINYTDEIFADYGMWDDPVSERQVQLASVTAHTTHPTGFIN